MTQSTDMNTVTPKSISRELRPLSVWIPMILLPCMVIARFIPEWIENGPSLIWMSSAFGPFLIGLLIVLWWLLMSRAHWREKIIGLVGIVAIIVAVTLGLHSTMQGPLVVVMTVPMALAGFAITLVVLRNRLSFQRTFLALIAALAMAAVSLFFKSDGVWGNFAFNLDWRWQPTSEERLLQDRVAQKAPANPAIIPTTELVQSEWPQFRGPNQNSVQRGKVFTDDWSKSPPKELWRIKVGPAWSSFVVAGNYLFTQEQRGEEETVVCYDGRTGQQAWEQGIESRFFEALGGLGPRATPTLSGGYLYTLGAEGNLLKISASSGELVWRVDLHQASGRKELPMWGYSSSPFVQGGLVVVHAGGEGQKGVIAFDCSTGEQKWSAPAGRESYSSVQLLSLLGQDVLVLLSEQGAHFMEPSSGQILLDYSWKHNGYRSLQPQVIANDKVILPSGLGSGTRMIQLSKSDGSLKATELWTSLDMKPDFNDLIIHKGYAYGFDNAIFACIDLQNGKRKWKGGRYAKGQALLLADSDLILVVSEAGEIVLIRANSEKLQELGKLKALDGKTWNHPVIAGDRLYLRNSEEAACYQLPSIENR